MVNAAKPPAISLEKALAKAKSTEMSTHQQPGTFLSGIRYLSGAEDDIAAAYKGSYPAWVIIYSMNYSVKEVTSYQYVDMAGNVSSFVVRQ
jgi:hypothetical protein